MKKTRKTEAIITLLREKIRTKDANAAQLREKIRNKDAVVARLKERIERKNLAVGHLKEKIQLKDATIASLKERVRKKNKAIEKIREKQLLVEGDKGRLEQTYYDIYFDRLSDAKKFSSKIKQLKESLTELSENESAHALKLIDQLETETHIDIPTLKPYPRLRVDLGRSEECDDFCRQHRRRLTKRMVTAFAGTRVNAILDLNLYANLSDYLEAVRAASKGNVIREAKKSESYGLICNTFDPKNYLNDIDAILKSKPERQAGALRPPYDQGAENFLQYVEKNHPNRTPACPLHHNTWHGIFEAIGKNYRLLGFIMVERHGQFGHYRHIMGHADWLALGIMYQLHFAVLKWIYASQPGLTLVSYAQWTDLPDVIDIRPGLTRWKKKALFKPVQLIETLQGSPEQIRNEILENSQNKIFPNYVLENCDSVACLYSAALMGQRDVIHFTEHNIQDVTLVDHDAEMMAEMRKAYPSNWSYLVGDAFEFIHSARSKQKRFDVVTLDPWVYLETANIKIMKSIVGIAKRYVLISLTDIHFFRPNHLKPINDDAFQYFHALSENIIDVDVVLSTKGFGGLYWCVLKLI